MPWSWFDPVPAASVAGPSGGWRRRVAYSPEAKVRDECSGSVSGAPLVECTMRHEESLPWKESYIPN